MIVEDEPWVEMSAFPDDEEDPDAAVSAAELELLRGALAVDGTGEPTDALWEHMLAEAVGGGDLASPDAAGDEPLARSEPVEESVTDDPFLAPDEPWAENLSPDEGHPDDPASGHDHAGDGP